MCPCIDLTNEQPRQESTADARLLHAAKSRLRLELQGLAFAISRGATPEEYARFLWSKGAANWMGCTSPGTDDYLEREEEAMRSLFPWLKIRHESMSADEASVEISGGCLGGWGENRFALARSLGLNRSALCRYCQEACKVWGEQLSLKVEPVPGPGCRGGCRIKARKMPAPS